MPGLPTATDEEVGFQPIPSNPYLKQPGSAPGSISRGGKSSWGSFMPPNTYEPIVDEGIIHFNPVIILFMSLVPKDDLTKAGKNPRIHGENGHRGRRHILQVCQ